MEVLASPDTISPSDQTDINATFKMCLRWGQDLHLLACTNVQVQLTLFPPVPFATNPNDSDSVRPSLTYHPFHPSHLHSLPTELHGGCRPRNGGSQTTRASTKGCAARSSEPSAERREVSWPLLLLPTVSPSLRSLSSPPPSDDATTRVNDVGSELSNG